MRAFAAMIPRLDAEERLNAMTDHGAVVGGGKNHGSDRARHIRALEKAAQGGQRRRAAKASPATLAGMGIGVVSGASEPSQEAINDG